MLFHTALSNGRIILLREIVDGRVQGNVTLHCWTAGFWKNDTGSQACRTGRDRTDLRNVWLSKLSDGISSFDDYLKWSRRCRSVIGPLVIQILKAGTSVVLDFAGNTPAERKWVRSLFEESEAKHVLHYLDVPEDECLARLKVRNETKPEGLFFAEISKGRILNHSSLVPAPGAGRRLLLISRMTGYWKQFASDCKV
jgi:hypothetical protein